ncbi:class C beta-lactamase [Cupriavidus numazuensis]|uniref:Beta-lactamase n=1 Tax=Cupriavidus numazuensis TaxID=221992 RepID=A0ABN7QBU6_9BURK|nr:class C beta-lactamase [Cupriavidus numazuensis]CAG2158253.1 Beta-lactamase [Cupriavidus numazuensis]
MKVKSPKPLVASMLCALCVMPSGSQATDMSTQQVQRVVDEAIRPLMARDKIPGMAVGVIVEGKRHVFNYGVASTETIRPVTDHTLFELGSVTKTFTATLSSWAQEQKKLSLSDNVATHLPELRGSPFGTVTLLNLGTHTPGGLPLQVPDDVRNEDQLIDYFKAWRPTDPAGTYRTYSNPGIGTLGLITAKSMGQDFVTLIEQRLFPELGIKNSFIKVPTERGGDYAQGYTKEGKPIRMTDGVLGAEAYGLKSTASDMLRFVEANMQLASIDGQLQSAITNTHTGYFTAGPMTQDLIWEQYPYPVTLKALLEGNAPRMAFNATPVQEIEPPLPPEANAWINKTGSTNGFGAYVAFVPRQRIGIVMLANRNFPIEDRVKVAFAILDSVRHRTAPAPAQ